MATTPHGADETDARTAMLDAVERLMLSDGYAAVTSRRVAAEAGVNAGLVYYYFGPMDNLFVEVFRRSAARMLEQQAKALAAEQPLWALWDLIRDQTNTGMNLEFLALGNHRKIVQAEMKNFSIQFRRQQFEAMTAILGRYDIDTEQWPVEAITVLLDGAARFMGEERSYGLSLGHAQATGVVERLITEVEGQRVQRRKRR
ncbi:TetR/AcrR family transcriptional regulator [Mycobacterium sp. CVI_P3]|uniref:TetR/AcrR family transcriptional regulator n=1 Tax=Mycobacterium pinniadriaticum TaxID=2994102 RepID=A0ABT3SPB6_9MYCO|nr:TetR/AcrR family transcriptional regulator [Mycobacterium pinniadriaticum]MCX2934566.1 TetR/AcrR family transcriptional regulator [Mycobacterium pinniadriaticum]MCX2940989.1 TetR/AcrR family transcriptional regulator [Mycobacterium pinniadriaticum]